AVRSRPRGLRRLTGESTHFQNTLMSFREMTILAVHNGRTYCYMDCYRKGLDETAVHNVDKASESTSYKPTSTKARPTHHKWGTRGTSRDLENPQPCWRWHR